MSLDSKGIGNVLREARERTARAENLAQTLGGVADVSKSVALSATRRSRQAQARNRSLMSASQLINETNLGRLPTLGLNQIKLEEFKDQDNNMFRI